METTLIQADRISDYIPVVSTLSNVVDLLIKAIVLPIFEALGVEPSDYANYLKEKSFGRCALLAFPIIGQIANLFLEEVSVPLREEAIPLPVPASEFSYSKLTLGAVPGGRLPVLAEWETAPKVLTQRLQRALFTHQTAITAWFADAGKSVTSMHIGFEVEWEDRKIKNTRNCLIEICANGNVFVRERHTKEEATRESATRRSFVFDCGVEAFTPNYILDHISKYGTGSQIAPYIASFLNAAGKKFLKAFLPTSDYIPGRVVQAKFTIECLAPTVLTLGAEQGVIESASSDIDRPFRTATYPIISEKGFERTYSDAIVMYLHKSMKVRADRELTPFSGVTLEAFGMWMEENRVRPVFDAWMVNDPGLAEKLFGN